MKRIILLFLVFLSFNAVKGQTYTISACSGAPFNFVVPTPTEPAGTRYTWTTPFAPGLVGGAGQPVSQITVTGTLNNNTSAVITATYAVSSSSGNNYTLHVLVTPFPVANPINDQDPVCPGDGTPIIPVSGPKPNTVFFWSYSTAFMGIPSSGGPVTDFIQPFTAQNNSNVLRVTTIDVTPNINGCSGTSVSFRIPVKPMPNVTNNIDRVYCHGTIVPQINFSTNLSGSIISWTTDNTSFGLNPNGGSFIPTFTATNLSQTPITAVVSVSGFSNGCSGPAESFNITVNPLPEMMPVSNISICGGLSPTVTFSAPSYPGTTYNWTNSDAANGLPASGTGQVSSFIANNFSNIPVTSNFVVTPFLMGCPGSPVSFTMEVKSTPRVNALSNVTNCNNTIIGPLNFTGSFIDGTEYQWQHTISSIGLGSLSGVGSIAAFTATNPGNVPVVSNFTVRPFSNTCFGPAINFSVRVNPTPKMASVFDQSSCEFLNASAVTFSADVAGTVFNWSNNRPEIGLAATGVGNVPAFTYINPGVTDIVATVIVIPVSNTCSGIQVSYSYTVRAAPDLVQPFSQTRCNGTLTDQVNFVSTSMPGSTFTWTRNNIFVGTLPLSGTGNIDPFTAVNLSGVPIQTIITVTPFSNNCNGPSRTFNIIINPTPSVTVSPAGPISICSGLTTTVTFSGSNVNNTIYQWTNTNSLIGLASSGTGSITPFTTLNTSSFPIGVNVTVTPISNSCQGTPVAFSIIVRPTPFINTLTNVTVCSDNSVNAITFTGSIVSGTQYNWSHTTSDIGLLNLTGTGDIPAFSATNIYNVPISSQFSVTPFSNGCSGMARIFTVRVNPTPSITPIADRILCAGTTVNLSFGGSLVANTTYNWSNTNTGIGIGATGSASSLIFTSNNTSNIPIIASLTVTPSSNTCNGIPTAFSITVYPSVALNTIADQVRCSGTITNEIKFTGSLVSNTIYSWTNSNTFIGLASTSGTGDIPAFTTTTPSNVPIVSFFTVTAMSNSCNSITRSFSIVVNPVPTVTPTPQAVYCSGSNINLNFNGSAVPGTIYQWTNSQNIGLAPSGSTANNAFTATNLSNLPVTSLITVTPMSNACSGLSNSFTITVNPLPTVLPIADQRVCHNESIAAINFAGSNITGTVYNWTRTNVPFGSLPLSGTGNIASFTAVNLGNTPVTAIFTVVPVSNTCSGNPITFSITISPLPTVEPVASLNLCGGQPTGNINFTDFNILGTQFNWTNTNPNIGLPLSGSGPIASFTATNNFQIPISSVLTVTPISNACTGNSIQFTIVVRPTPIVNQETDQIVCEGATINGITFTGSAIENTIYNWTSSNAAIGLSTTSGVGSIPSFTSSIPSNIPLTSLITVVPVSNSCSGTPMQYTIRVNPIPSVAAVPSLVVCGNQTILPINFTGTTANGNDIVDGTTFNWTNTNPNIGIPASGIGSIAAFSASNNFFIPTTGMITVTPVSNACTGTPISFSIQVQPTPTVNLVISQNLCANIATLPVTLDGSNIANTIYSWTSSNPNVGLASSTGTGNIPSFVGTNLSVDPISSLITVVPYSNTCYGTPVQFYITVNPIPSINPISNIEVCGNALVGPIVFSGSPMAGTVYQWTNSNSNIGLAATGLGTIPAFTISNYSNVPVTAEFEVTPISNSCQGTPTQFSILIKSTPTMDPVPNQELCTNLVTTPSIFTGSTIAGTEYRWSQTTPAVGLAAMTGTGNIASFTTTNSSNIPISSLFTVRAYSNSCYSTPVLFSINVNPIPSVNDIADLNVCGNQVTGPIVFMGSPLSGTLYQWTNSNPSIGLATSGTGTIAAFSAANNFNTTITAFITVTPLSNTCVGIQKQFSITVRPTPTIDPIPDRVFCTQATSSSILFAGSTIPGSIYQWSHDNAAIGLSIMSGEVSVPSFTCANLSNTRISSRFMVTPFSNGCSGVPAVFSITVDPIPRLDQVQDVVICGDRKIEGIIFTGSPIAGTVFNWTNNNSSIGLANSGVGNIVAFTASNNSTVPIAAQITVVPFSNTCSGSPVSFSITIKPTPVADPIPNQVLCANYPTAPVVFSGSAIPGTLYNWTNSFSAIGLAPSGTGNIASFNATSSYNIPVSSNITVIPFTNGCHGDPTSFLITVNPIPTVNPLTSQIVCADQQVGTIVFSGSIMGGTVYEWTNNNSAVGLGTTGIGNIPAFTAVNTSNITISSLISVTPISNACRGVTESMILTVKPTPIVHTVSNYAYCGGTLTQPIIFDGSVIQNTLYNWVQTNVNTGLSAISGTGNIPAFTTLNSSNIPVNSLVTVTPFTNGCTGPSKSFNILVNPAPSINPVSDIVSCGNGMISAINFSGSIVPSTEYRWTNDNLSIGLPSSGIGSIAAFTATNNFSVPVVARITVTPFSNNCQGLPISFSITIKPTPSINSISNQVACANTLTQPVIFDGSTISGTQYQWSSTLNTIGLGTSAGTGNIPAFTATTVSNIPVTARFTVTPISNSCAGSPTFFDITVNPIPSVNTVPDIIQCGLISTQPIVFQGSGVPSTIYEWTNNNVSIGIPAAGTGTIQPFTATNSANQLISAQIQVTPFSNNCAGSPKQFNIKIKPVPKVDTISNQILCAGQSTTGVLFSGSAIANTQYNWTATNGLTGIPTLTGSGFIPAFTTVNNTNVTVSNLITVTPFTNGCSSLPITFQYIVHPTPNIQPVADLITCGSRQLGPILFNGSNVAGTLYSWTNVNSAIGIPAAGIGNIEPFTPMNVSTAPLASVITVTPISNTCVGASISFSVVIKPIPVMTSLLPQIVCNQTRTAPILFASSLSNTTYTWSNSDPATGLPFTTGSGNIPAFTATNSSPLPISSQFTIQPLADGCNGLAQTVTITVTPTPVLSSSLLPTGICNGGVFSYTATTATPGTNFIWQRNATPAINGNTSSGGFTANIQELLTSTNSQSMSIFYTIDMTAAGCTNTQSITVTLSPAAVLAGLPVPTSVCSGSIFSYTTQTTTPNTLITWRRDQIPGISNPTNTGVSIISEILNNTTIQPISVRYEVTLTSGGCSNPQSITTVILPLPAIANQTLTTCSGVLIEFTPVNTVENTLLTWSLPLTTPASSITGMQGNSTPKNIFSQTLISNTTQVALATYSVQTRANNCFGNAFSLTVQILPSPVFNSVTLTPVCSGSTFTYVPLGSASNSTFTWSLPDQRPKNSLTGATTGLNQPVFSQTLVALNTIRDTAIYSVQPISGNCTGAPFSITIIVNPVALVTDKTDTVCSGSRYTYLPENVPAGSDFIWEIPEIIPLGAVSGTQQQITPAAIFSQLPVNLTQQMATLRYRIYAISDNCTSQPFQLQLVVTRPIPVIAQQYRQTCSGIQVDLTPRNVPTGITYSWDVPIIQNNSGVTGMSGSSSNVPVIQQQLINRSTTRETVDYTIYPYRDNCIGEPFIGTVAIVPLPKVSINGPGALCQNVNDTLQFNFNGVGPWRFRFDDNGNTGSRSLIRSNPYTLILPPTGTSAIGGTRNIKIYQVEDSACANPNDTVYVTQRIDRLPVGRILSLRGNYICNNTLDTLFVITADSVNYQWYWNGNILPTATQDSISTNWPGVYQVRLTNGSGCSDTAIAPVRLLSVSRPVVKFRFDYSCINTPIRFFNQTDSLKSGPLSWNWDFGNGQTDTTFNTQSSYQVPGIYHVILTAKQKNCDAFPATILDSVIQIVQPIDRVDLPTISAYKNVNKVITGRDLPGYIYKWSPSFGLIRTDSASTIFNYSINMKYGISMTSKEGCVTTDSLFIRVFNDKLVEIFVPKSFTPNGDGVNDKIFAYTAGIREFKHFKIINRNGKQLFETRNIDQGWDGVYNGTPQPMSIYFWVAEGIADDGSVVQRSGQFLLIR